MITSLCIFIDNISDFEPTSENTFSIKSPSQAPKSLIAFPKSAKDCPSSNESKLGLCNSSCYPVKQPGKKKLRVLLIVFEFEFLMMFKPDHLSLYFWKTKFRTNIICLLKLVKTISP